VSTASDQDTPALSSTEIEGAGPPGLAGGLGRARTDGTVTMLIGTLLSGLAAYIWQAIGTRTLGNVRFAPVATMWTLSYLVITVLLAPIEQYATRTISSGADGRVRLARDVPTLIKIALGAIVVLTIGSFLVRGKFFHGQAAYAIVAGLLVACFGLLAFVRGVFAGERDFRLYGWLTGLDGVSRLALGALILILGGSPLLFSLSIPICALVSVLWLRRIPRQREGTPGRSESHVPVRRFMATMVGGTAAAQLLLAGGPLLLGLLGAPDRTVTILFVAQTAGRATLLVALPLWARALPTLTGIALGHGRARLSQLAERVLAASVVVAAMGAGFAALAGPPVLGALFGSSSRPPTFVAGAIGAGTVLAVGNLGLNQLLVAAVRTSRITISWWMALAIAVLWVALGPGSALDRVVTGFVIGEAVAMLSLTIASSPARAPVALRRMMQWGRRHARARN
jgi:O-antigen/teichoic acid export membrane protein